MIRIRCLWASVFLLVLSPKLDHTYAFEIPSSFHVVDALGYYVPKVPSLECNHILSSRRLDLLSLTTKLKFDYNARAVKTALYPCSGTNSSLPFLLYHNVETAYMIDLHPIVKRSLSDQDRISPSIVRPQRYRLFKDIDNDFSDGIHPIESLLGDLYLYNRSIHIRSIQLFSTDPSNEWNIQQSYVDQFAIYKGTEVNAVIQFDTGEGTPLRKIVYIQAESRKSNNWWRPYVEADRPEGFIVMAAMQIFNDHSMKFDLRFKDWLSGLFYNCKGNVLVEGMDLIPQESNYYEFTGARYEGEALKGVKLGYKNNIQVTVVK